MTDGLIWQVPLLVAMAWAVPWLLGRLLPEGVAWLMAIGALSAAILTGATAAGFAALYGAAGGVVWREAPGHFLVLSLRAALIWGPVMVLSVANLPRGWKEAVW